MAKQKDFSEIDTEGINEERKKIIEIVEELNKELSIPQIIIKLKFAKLPWEESSMSSSVTRFHRIIHCQENNPKGDHIGEIKYSELLPLLQETFSTELRRKKMKIEEIDFNEDIILPTHSDYYIYYYISYEETTKEYNTKFALIGFDTDPVTMEWQTGKIYYLQDQMIHKVFELKRIEPEKTNPNVLFFTAHLDMQVNFFTIKINYKRKEFRGILPLTYSVTETQSNLPCAGKGILEKVNNSSYKKAILDLMNENIGIKSSIINALYLKKYVLNELLFDKPLDFSNSQTELIQEFRGVWEGVYLRPDLAKLHRSSSTEKGGLCKFALYIKDTCECELHYEVEDLKKHCYNGFIEFPFSDKSLMKISLELLKEKRIYRLYAFLSAGSIGGSDSTYAGVISGWANISKAIYSSTIYMQQVLKIKQNISQTDIQNAIKDVGAKRIPKTNENVYLGNEELIETLKQLENGHLAMFSNCMPK